ncbi:MAG: adenosylcobinamide-GDP ribazoletransferase [Rhodospirillales bacterium]|nr:adenosylcobinamide-GDP ribazoletransferase [Rhodospirillales bacterium]
MSFDERFRTSAVLPFLAGWRDDLLASGSFLTRLPLYRLVPIESGLLARSMRAFPLVGVVVGLIGWAAFAIAAWLGLPPAAMALLALTATVLVTGGLHEDGLADTADGFGGGADRERKLAIMRDSRSGAYGVMALIFSLGLRVAALAALTVPEAGLALIAAHAVSRAAMPLLMRFLAPSRPDGLGASAGQPDEAAQAWCLAIAVVVALLCLGLSGGIAALVAAAIAVAAIGTLAQRQIGGHTGDVLGAAQQMAEIAVLLTVAAL